MRSSHSKSDFLWYRDAVTDQMRAGHPFGEVEDAIELADLSDDQKAALWLFAFSLRDFGERVRDANTFLAAVTD